MLKIEDLVVCYGKAVALDGVSLYAKEGECVAVIGANGAGKTTLLNAVLGLLYAAQGSITHEAERVDSLSTEARVARGMVLVPESRDLFGAMTVEDNLRLGAYLHRFSGEHGTLERVYELFPKLKDRRRQEVATLSGGEQQMVAIGRALMTRPRLMLLDEPSIGLAPIIVEQIFEAIDTLKKQGMTTVVVEQNARLALGIADRAYIMELGRITMEGDARRMADDPHLTAAYFGALR